MASLAKITLPAYQSAKKQRQGFLAQKCAKSHCFKGSIEFTSSKWSVLLIFKEQRLEAAYAASRCYRFLFLTIP
jgi:hypothetical protein